MNTLYKTAILVFLCSIPMVSLSMEKQDHNEYKDKSMTFMLTDIEELLKKSPELSSKISHEGTPTKSRQTLEEIQEENDQLMQDLIDTPQPEDLTPPLTPKLVVSSPTPPSQAGSSPLAENHSSSASQGDPSPLVTPSPTNPTTNNAPNNPPSTSIKAISLYHPLIITSIGALIVAIAYKGIMYKNNAIKTRSIELDEPSVIPDQTVIK